MVFVPVRSDATLGFATAQVLGGLVFSLGLLLMVVAGTERFTGSNPLVMAGRSVMDKAVVIVFPISAFVAAGFEHSIANMYRMLLAMPIPRFGAGPQGAAAVTVGGMTANLAVVIAGNLIGGGVLVGLTDDVIDRRGQPTAPRGKRNKPSR